jgi:heme/copper-type cytochrome/quinol oxidase subunit 2
MRRCRAAAGAAIVLALLLPAAAQAAAPSWSGVNSDAFTAGFGIVELVAGFLFAFLISFVMVRRLLTAAGLL